MAILASLTPRFEQPVKDHPESLDPVRMPLRINCRNTLYFWEAPDRVEEVLAFDRASATQAPDEAVSANRPRGSGPPPLCSPFTMRCGSGSVASHGRPFSTAAISASERS